MKKIEVVGKGGRRIIPESDIVKYLAKGYQVVDENYEMPETPKEVDEPEDVEPIEAKINKMSNKRLKEFVEEAGININLDEFSNLAERKAAVIAIVGN